MLDPTSHLIIQLTFLILKREFVLQNQSSYFCLKLFIIGKMGSFLFSLQGFITDHERALEDLYGEDGEKSRKSEACLNEMGSRIATVFASLKVYLIN